MSRRVALGGVLAALVAAGALLAALAFGQDEVPIRITVTASVRPSRAGTPQRPQGIRIAAREDVSIPSGVARPQVQRLDAWLPKGWRYGGAKLPVCSRALLASGGPSRCPAGSIMGTALRPFESVQPRITVVNGGATRVYFWTVLNSPARVAAAVVGDIIRLNGDPRWSYHLRLTIPSSLQVVAGVQTRLDPLRVSAGRGDWLTTTSCPADHLWRYRVQNTFSTGQVSTYDGSVGCRS